MTVFLGRTDTQVCPVVAFLNYLVMRGTGEGPLFQFVNGEPLTRSRLVTELGEALKKAGMQPKDYAGHGFRIGVVTTAAACGVPVDVIKTLGR